MTQVVLIRPGATAYDEQKRVQGVLDLPLSARGKAEVVELAGHLGGQLLVAIYCGPGESAGHTAEAVGQELGLRPKRVEDLRNLDCGLWQGLQLDEIRRRNAKVFRQWLEEPLTVCPPNGESVASALDRIKAALRPLLRKHRNEAIALVAAEPIAALIGAFLRQERRVQLDDEGATGSFERIEVAPELCRNGDG
jgi:broad specificity phosphatase PhoE